MTELRKKQNEFQEVMSQFDTKRRELDFTLHQVSTLYDMGKNIDVPLGGNKEELMEAAFTDLSERTKDATEILNFLNEAYKVWFKITPGVESR